jgi:hypothetical protein
MIVYKEPSIITGTDAAIWPELTLSLLATIALEVVPFRTYALFPVLLPYIKCILEVVFCAQTVILPRSPQLYQNGSLSVLFSMGETAK